MTRTDTTASPTSRTRPELVERVLDLRTRRAEAAALRRANVAELRSLAIPLVGGVRPPVDEAGYLFVALCATFTNVKDDSSRRIGRALRLTDPDRGSADGSVARRLSAIQNQPLELAARTIQSLFSITELTQISWADLYFTYRSWDHDERSERLKTRQRLLLDFYAPPPAMATTTTNDSI